MCEYFTTIVTYDKLTIRSLLDGKKRSIIIVNLIVITS